MRARSKTSSLFAWTCTCRDADNSRYAYRRVQLTLKRPEKVSSTFSMAATVASAVPPDVALFLQDVIGDALQDGKLRQYHARIVKEVEQSKVRRPFHSAEKSRWLIVLISQIDLHATVQKEWPNLDKQLRNSLELTQRLQELQDDIARVEQELEGSVSPARLGHFMNVADRCPAGPFSSKSSYNRPYCSSGCAGQTYHIRCPSGAAGLVEQCTSAARADAD